MVTQGGKERETGEWRQPFNQLPPSLNFNECKEVCGMEAIMVISKCAMVAKQPFILAVRLILLTG